MFYGDLHLIDIILFAGLAAFLFYRLRGVLGKRTGFEKKGKTSSVENISEKIDKKNIPVVEKKLDQNIQELEKAYKHIKNFDHVNFLDGAKNAFEIIVNFFNDGNKVGLKPLLEKNTYKGFCDAIDSNKNQPKSKILSVNIELVNSVWVEGKLIFVMITFLSSQIDKNGKSKENKKDKWTFQKNLFSQNPAWLLTST